MKTKTQYRFLHLMYLFFIFLLGVFAQPVMASNQQVPDLLNTPSSKTEAATTALQLAIATAGKRLISVGERGIILLSDDNGVSWQQAEEVPVSVTLTSVSFVDDQRGWAAGHSGVILHTRDAGNTWTVQLDGYQAAQAAKREAQIAKNTGAENAENLATNADYLIKEGADKPFLEVHFFDDQHGMAVGAYGLAVETHDAGKTWIGMMGQIPNLRGNHLYAVSERNGQILIAGEQGVLFLKDQDAKAFESVDSPYDGTFFGAELLADGSILAYGLKGNVWLSTSDKTHWESIDLGMQSTLTSGTLMNNAFYLADEAGHLYRAPLNDLSLFSVLTSVKAPAITGVIKSDDHALVVSGVRGNLRFSDALVKAE